MNYGIRILTGALVAASVALTARRAGSLSRSGAFAAAVVGTAAVGAGWDWAGLLVSYFVTSALLSRVGRHRKLELTRGMIEKGGARDAVQVVSNGLPFTIFAILSGLHVMPDHSHRIMGAAAASLAASAADTWGTEIGTWVGQTPRSIISGRKLAVGQSGGVTVAGQLGSMAGAFFIAATVLLFGWRLELAPAIIAGGLGGALADSLAGAIVQQRRWCDACAVPTEMRTHDCGTATRAAGGLSFVTNDGVNLLATVVGALIGLMLTPSTYAIYN